MPQVMAEMLADISDILVDKKNARRASKIVSEVGAQFGWKTYGVLIQGMMRSVWLLKEDSNNGQSYLRIDIETGNEYRGVEIHESQRYLKDRIWDEERKLWYMSLLLLKEHSGCEGIRNMLYPGEYQERL